MICRCGERTRSFSRAWRARKRRAPRRARGHAARCRIGARTDILPFDGLVKIGSPKPKRVQATSTARSPSSTMRSRRPNKLAITIRRRTASRPRRTPPNVIPPTGSAQRPCRPPSSSRSGKGRVASNCAPRCRSPSCTNLPAAPSTPTPSSRPQSKAFRRLRKCPKSPRRRRCSRRSHRRTKSRPTRHNGCESTHLHVAYGNALLAARGWGAKETTEAFARAREFGVWRQERVRTTGGGLSGCGSAATCEASCDPCGRTRRRLPQKMSRSVRIHRRPASPIAPQGLRAPSPASISRRGIISSGRSPCSNPAATTIWPFALDRTPASR